MNPNAKTPMSGRSTPPHPDSDLDERMTENKPEGCGCSEETPHLKRDDATNAQDTNLPEADGYNEADETAQADAIDDEDTTPEVPGRSAQSKSRPDKPDERAGR